MKKRILSLVALPGFFKGDFYEVSVDYIKTLFLGVRRSVVRVLALVVLLACCVSPAYAEFGSTDSNNLSSIRTNVQNIWNRLNTNFDYRLSSLASLISTANSTLSAINTNLLNTVGWNLGKVNENLGILYDKTEEVRSLLDSISSKVDTLIQNQETQIQNQETQISNQETQIQNQQTQIGNQETQIQNQEEQIQNEEDIFYSINPTYEILGTEPYVLGWDEFEMVFLENTSGVFSSVKEQSEPGLWPTLDVDGVYKIFFLNRPHTDSKAKALLGGREYYFSLSVPAVLNGELTSVFFSYSNGHQSVLLDSSQISYTFYDDAQFGNQFTISFRFVPPETSLLTDIFLKFNDGVFLNILSGGYLRAVIQAVDPIDVVDSSLSDATNSGQSQITNDVQSSVGQLDDFDNEIFQNVADYTAKLDFGLSSWGEAAAGIAYIGSIFLMIWNNSPTQVVVLSLMIGLCILLLGRGARVAGAVRRSHRDDDGGGG